MADEAQPQPIRATWWSRFWYFTAWRLVGLLLLALAVRDAVDELWTQATMAFMFGITYLVLLPMIMTNMFRFGYSVGVSDALVYAAGGDEAHLRHGLHPAEATSDKSDMRRHGR